MTIHQAFCRRKRGNVPGLVLLIFAGMLPAAHAGEFANVVGANGSNGRLLALDFDAGVALTISDDANGVVSPQSADFFEDTCRAQLDVVVADNNGGQLIRYENPDPTDPKSGLVFCAAGDPNCPSRPNALAFSAKRRGLVAESGDAGLVPRLFVFDPLKDETDSGNCEDNSAQYYPFDTPKKSGPLQVCQPGYTGCMPVGKIEDSIFVEVPGGGSWFVPGALLVVTSNPTTLSIVESSTIDAIADGTAGDPTKAIILAVPSDFAVFGSEFGAAFSEAVAIGIIQNSAGVGTADGKSDSEEMVVATKRGQTLRFRFSVEPPAIPVDSPTLTGVRQFIPDQGVGSLDLAFGIVGDEVFATLADRQQGNFMKIPLEDVCADPEGDRYDECLDQEASPPVPQYEPVESPWPVIRDNVEQPKAVAINVNGLKGSDCDSDTTGCPIRNTLTLNYTDKICGADENPLDDDCTKQIEVDETENIIANIWVVQDPRTSYRDLTQDEMRDIVGLPDYTIPAICGGIPLADNGNSKVLVLAEIAQGWDMTAGNLAKVEETIESIFPQAAGCGVNGTRHFYHQTRNANDDFQVHDGEVWDSTYLCRNPSSGGKIGRSVSVICSDQLYGPISTLSGNRQDRAIKDEGNRRIDFLRDYFQELDNVLATDGDPEGLADVLDDLRLYLDDVEGELRRKKFEDASTAADKGSLATHAAKNTFVQAAMNNANIPASAYAFTLIHFVNLAFFTYEDGVGRSPTPYLPPCGLDLPGESEGGPGPDTCRTRL